MTQTNETKKILVQVLSTKFNEPCVVHVKIFTAEMVIQRVRVELSRARKKAIARHGAKNVPDFKLRADIVRSEAVKHDTIIFKKIRDTLIAVDMSDIDKILDDVVKEEAAAKAAVSGPRKIVIKQKVAN